MQPVLRHCLFILVNALTILYGWAQPIATEPPAAAEQENRPHIALILPLASPSFGRHAEAARQGFLAAAKAQGGTDLPVISYPVGDDPTEALAAYKRAVDNGARVVVGPLTRDAVAALAASDLVSVPTLALNALDADARLPAQLYLFGLQADTEARQVARIAFEQGRRSALTVSDDTPLARRLLAAFTDEFTRLGGRQQAAFAYSASPIDLNALRQAAASGNSDVVFIALDGAKTRLLRPYLGNAVPIYATSQVASDATAPTANYELNGIRFVDMPWLLAPDHPAVMVYPRPPGGDAVPAELERLYALGIDAWRIAADLIGGHDIARAPLDGVTGRITLSSGRLFTRESMPARYSDGKAVAGAEPQ